jgi:hypothetical protein
MKINTANHGLKRAGYRRSCSFSCPEWEWLAKLPGWSFRSHMGGAHTATDGSTQTDNPSPIQDLSDPDGNSWLDMNPFDDLLGPFGNDQGY